MDNYIIYNGRKVEITNDIEKLIKEKEGGEKFRVKNSDVYYYSNSVGIVSAVFRGSNVDNKRVSCGNAGKNKNIMLHMQREQILYRLLYRFSIENGWNEELWENSTVKYCIGYDYILKKYEVFPLDTKAGLCGVVPFITKEMARIALYEIVLPFYNEELECCKDLEG